MKTIWKYQLFVTDQQIITMKQGAQILTVQAQNDVLCIWALVDPEEPSERRTFRVYGTGHPVSDNPGQYIGTTQFLGGSLVFHVFEVTS